MALYHNLNPKWNTQSSEVSKQVEVIAMIFQSTDATRRTGLRQDLVRIGKTAACNLSRCVSQLMAMMSAMLMMRLPRQSLQ